MTPLFVLGDYVPGANKIFL